MVKKLLITGGLGYLGGRIIRHLTERQADLHLRITSIRERVPNWAQPLELVQADMRDKASLRKAVAGMEAVIHLAAVNEVEAERDPLLALEVNARGTYLLLQACREAEVPQFIYFSTFHVYGPGAREVITEETATRPVHPYALTHRTAEDLVNWFRHAFGLQTLILRLSNGYGYPADPYVDRWTLVFNDLCRQAVEHGRIALRSSGRQQRDFIALSDVARAVEHLLALGPQRWQDGLFNLGGECSLSILQVAQTVLREYRQRYGRDLPVSTRAGPESTTYYPVEYDIRKLKATGFTLVGNIQEEVQGTLELCEEVVQREPSGLKE